jgi:hypothetical protein
MLPLTGLYSTPCHFSIIHHFSPTEREGTGDGKRQGLSIAIFNFQRMFLATHDPIFILFWDFWRDPVLCLFL